MNTKKNKNNLLIINYPELLSEWDYKKNNANNIDVNTVTYGSKIKAWWKCSQYGHSYQMMIQLRTSGSGCPFCAGKKVLTGFNDLLTLCPELIESEWDWIENDRNNINPSELTKYSHKKASWLCQQYKHSYKSTVANRMNGAGCPYCSNQKILTGFNDLQTQYPDLVASEWDYVRNDANNIHPDEISKGTKRKVAWLCQQYKHSYLMTPLHKINGEGCPYCSGHQVLRGFNDLLTLCPDLMVEWNWAENNRKNIHPDKLTMNSNIKVSWKCHECKHEWLASVNKRTGAGKTGCPACAKRTSKQEDEVAAFIKNYLHNYANMD